MSIGKQWVSNIVSDTNHYSFYPIPSDAILNPSNAAEEVRKGYSGLLPTGKMKYTSFPFSLIPLSIYRFTSKKLFSNYTPSNFAIPLKYQYWYRNKSIDIGIGTKVSISVLEISISETEIRHFFYSRQYTFLEQPKKRHR